MGIGCIRMAMLMKHREQGLSEADRLLLEEHLGTCPKCRSEALTIDALGDLVDAAWSPSLGAATRSKLVASAIRKAKTTQTPTVRADLGIARRAVWVGAVGLAASFVVWFGSRLLAHEPVQAVQMASAPSATAFAEVEHDRVESGGARALGRPLAAGEAMPEGAALSLDEGAALTLGHAHVVAASQSEVQWESARALVDLRNGGLSVSVDPAPGRRFRVNTRSFIVEVVGTDFHVDGNGVRVDHGVVQVLDRKSERLLAELHGGESWSVPVTPLPVPSAGEPLSKAAGEWLVEARRLLAAGAVSKAEHAVASALAARPSRVEAAEAKTLAAECALVAGRIDQAADLYLEVSKRYADLPAGETALFAAARAQVNASHRRVATELFRSYLDRYPRGRFLQEATTRLQALERNESP